MPGCQISSRNQFSDEYETTHSIVYFVFQWALVKSPIQLPPQPKFLSLKKKEKAPYIYSSFLPLSKKLYTQGICLDIRFLVGINFKLNRKPPIPLSISCCTGMRKCRVQGCKPPFLSFSTCQYPEHSRSFYLSKGMNSGTEISPYQLAFSIIWIQLAFNVSYDSSGWLLKIKNWWQLIADN